MSCETRLDERHDHRNLLRIVISTLPVETDERTASANRFVYIHVRVYKISQLFESRLAGNSGMSKDRQVGRHMRTADSAEDLAFIRGNLVPRADFAKRAQ